MMVIDLIRNLNDDELYNFLFRFPTCYWCREWRNVGLKCDVMESSKTCFDLFKEALNMERESLY